MAVLQLQNIGMGFGDRALFAGGSFGIEAHDKVGFIGGNGVGKTTLFRIIAGQIAPTEGQVALSAGCRIGYLEQHAMPDSDKTLYSAVESVFAPLRKIEEELADIALDIDNGTGDLEKLIERQHALNEAYRAGGGLTYKSRTRAALLGVGFSEEMLTRPVRVLSGGERTMASLVRLLLSEAELILLDEPTNHLDMEACVWLEDFLRAYGGAIFVISHDRYFLDRVTNKTLRLRGGKFTMYDGGYTAFTEKARAEDEYAARHYKKQQEEIRRIEGIIETQRRFNRERNIRMAESKQKQIDRIVRDMEEAPTADKEIFIRLHPARESAYEVMRAENIGQSFDGRPLFDNINITVYKNDRAFLLGPNGSGKTTFFSILRGTREAEKGKIYFGPRVDMGYFDQTQSDLPLGKTALEAVRDAYPAMTETELRSALAALGLCGDAVHEVIGTLSGGERAKVALVRLLLAQPNLLLLDEPTNHLDIDAKEALEAALLSYGGTIFAISHDRYFINKLATCIYAMEEGAVHAYAGDYTYYTEKREGEKEKATAFRPKKANTYNIEKAERAEKRKQENRRLKLEKEIGETEALINEKNAQMEGCGADYQLAMTLSEEIRELEEKLERLYEDWAED